MDAKPVHLSRTYMTELIFPQDTNYHGTVFGGLVMQYIDKVASIASMRHCRKTIVTASSDTLDFLAPAKLSEALVLEAFVTWTHRSSMEVYVKVQSEDLLTGEFKKTATSFLTFVAVDENGKAVPVPQVIPETDEERTLFESAPERYEMRKQRMKKEKIY
ncbi:hotdog domain-containing protein [Chengkuizengella sediminis]|uniref:hotdog domain-containing protein n=1 Tax=Chengkuizengella sediminis TaxID=1885917 RepID=UPI00138A336D|nr:acyl-CoA thioesterase [Chengkuizengella sediminis]